MDLKHVRNHICRGIVRIDPGYPVTFDGLVLKLSSYMHSRKKIARLVILVCSFLIYEFKHLYVDLFRVRNI